MGEQSELRDSSWRIQIPDVWRWHLAGNGRSVTGRIVSPPVLYHVPQRRERRSPHCKTDRGGGKNAYLELRILRPGKGLHLITREEIETAQPRKRESVFCISPKQQKEKKNLASVWARKGPGTRLSIKKKKRHWQQDPHTMTPKRGGRLGGPGKGEKLISFSKRGRKGTPTIALDKKGRRS